jgi:hypothetical protein
MYTRIGKLARSALCLFAAVLMAWFWSAGCASGTSALSLIGSPFTFTGSAPTTDTGTTGGQSTFFGGGGRVNLDPCSESNARKFIRISMRNLSIDSYIHYFLVLIAFVNGEMYPDGAVCPDDVDLYLQNGYSEIPEGSAQEFGNYCIVGPALLYFHDGGQFRRGGGGAQLGSAIAPAQGTSATYDSFFGSGGAQVPVPDLILFHNPGTGEGAALKISESWSSPCDFLISGNPDPDCDQDAFYYVDEFDLISGSNALGLGSGRRVPNEIQGTGCECTGFQDPFQRLAPSGVAASNARCNEFLRGGRIEYTFVRDDVEPPFQQLLWRVTDQSGAEVHAPDPRANVPP